MAITQNYKLFATAEYSLVAPDFTAIQGPPSYVPNTNINEAQVMELVAALQDKTIQISITSTSQIPDKIRLEVRKIVFPATPPLPLSTGNPILDVVANQSRPTGEADVWRPVLGYAVHPLSNNYAPTGTNSVTVAPRMITIPNDPLQWVYANVVAYKF
jgi:hypothetical protein